MTLHTMQIITRLHNSHVIYTYMYIFRLSEVVRQNSMLQASRSIGS